MKRNLKVYDSGRGVQMDSSFVAHTATCERCRAFDPAKPASAAIMCLEGSVLYKRDNQERAPRTVVDRGEHFASKAQVERLMRYKGD